MLFQAFRKVRQNDEVVEAAPEPAPRSRLSSVPLPLPAMGPSTDLEAGLARSPEEKTQRLEALAEYTVFARSSGQVISSDFASASLHEKTLRAISMIWSEFAYEPIDLISDCWLRKKADCDTSSVMVGDILLAAGVPEKEMRMVYLHDHAMLKVGGVYYETTGGRDGDIQSIQVYNDWNALRAAYPGAISELPFEDGRLAQVIDARGGTLFDRGEFKAALAERQALLAYLPNDPQTYYNIAQCQYELGQYDQAHENFEESHRRDPSDVGSIFGLADCAWKQGYVLDAIGYDIGGAAKAVGHFFSSLF